jgi:hypothetical protein
MLLIGKVVYPEKHVCYILSTPDFLERPELRVFGWLLAEEDLTNSGEEDVPVWRGCKPNYSLKTIYIVFKHLAGFRIDEIDGATISSVSDAFGVTMALVAVFEPPHEMLQDNSRDI